MKDGYIVYEVFCDEAISGRSLDRPAFQRMVALSKKTPSPFRRLYTWDIRRFGRNRIESAIYKQRLRSRGIEIIYLKENIEDSSTGRLVEGILETIAEYESCNIAEDTRRGHREITRRGYVHGGAAPYGYRHRTIMEGEKGRKGLEPDLEKGPLVAWIFHERLAGRSPGAIARGLNDKKIPASRGGLWNGESVRKLLENPIYIGRLEYGRQSVLRVDGKIHRKNHEKEQWTVCEGACEALVDREIWEAVQKLMEKTPGGGNHQEKKQVYLLSGLMTCSRCGNALIGFAKTRSTQHTRYYICRARTVSCSGAVVRADELE